jgi:hypothetical protein
MRLYYSPGLLTKVFRVQSETLREFFMATKPTGRGSAKLGVTALAIKSKLTGAKIIDWHELGTVNPELITGTIQVNITDVKANVATLTKLKELRDLNVLVHGIPVPNIAQIKFTLRG